MMQVVANAALIQGTVIVIAGYEPQEGFCLVTVLIAVAAKKQGVKFLGAGLEKKETKILASASMIKKIELQPSVNVSGEIKKAGPQLWRAVEDTWKITTGSTDKKGKKK